jgi:hypothetical protein
LRRAASAKAVGVALIKSLPRWQASVVFSSRQRNEKPMRSKDWTLVGLCDIGREDCPERIEMTDVPVCTEHDLF